MLTLPMLFLLSTSFKQLTMIQKSVECPIIYRLPTPIRWSITLFREISFTKLLELLEDWSLSLSLASDALQGPLTTIE